MPCRCDDYPPTPSGKDVIYTKIKKELDEVTQNLCFICGELSQDNLLNKYASNRIKNWWVKHSVQDTKRVSKSLKLLLKKRKLTPEQAANSLILKAQKVHPVSKFHQLWFHNLAHQIDNEINQEIMSQKTINQTKKQALAKLTKEEQILLGLTKQTK